MRTFCNYHKHDFYSNVRTSDSTVSLEAYAKRAVELKHNLLSSCCHGWQGNVFEGYDLAKQYGLKFLISAEAYFVHDRFEKDRTNCHIFLGAKNENGRQALNDVLSEANLTGFYGQPRVDISLLLSLPKDDIIVTTACVAYWRYDDIDSITDELAKHFGKNFFLEVQYHNTEAQRFINQKILKLHNELKIPLIMGCDSHYIYPEQEQVRLDFLASKGMHYEDEGGWMMDYPDGDTAYQRFANQCVLSHQEICDAMDNTNVFLEVEEYDSPVFDADIKMPSIYPDKTQKEKDEIYKQLIWQGWNEYKKEIPEEQHQHYEEEIQKEIQTVVDTKMSDYFILNHAIIQRGKENGGWSTKSGRGSAVSFFTNKLLGLTEVDRISAKIHMYPERFMSTTRILQSGSLPDIDMNVAPVEPFARAQQEILGEDHAYPMIAYGTFQKSAAWKLYAKSQGVPFEIANAVSNQIKKYENAVKHASEDEKESIDVLDYIDKEYHEIYLKSKDYFGIVTSWSIAPCGYCLLPYGIRKQIGLVKVKDHICCALDGHPVETKHFLKNDLLKVSVVDLIYKAYHRVGIEPPSVNELLKMCPPDDKCWDIYSQGCTLGINQCEQNGTTQRVMTYKPKNISELGAFIAAIRPGGVSYVKKFIAREPFSYGVKVFDDLIQTDEMPNSFLLYQEQVMAVLNFAGINMSDCYTAVKHISKKRKEKVLVYKETFVKGFTNAIIKEGKTKEESEDMAHQLWKVIEDSCSYSFNASHSYCVALDSLYCAWLKAHHPLEFYEVLLTISEEKGDKDKMNALKEEAESYFKIKFPPFRYGQDNSRIKADLETNTITNSLSAIKGFSTSVGDILYRCSQEVPVSDGFIAVLKWLDSAGIKASKVRPLIQIDYFQDFGNVNELLKVLDFWEFMKQGNAKTVKKETCPREYTDVFDKLCTQTAATYRIEDKADECFSLYEKNIKGKLKPPTMRQMIGYSIDILGYADVVTNREVDRRRLLITDVSPVGDSNGKPWAYRIGTRSLGSGKIARLTVKTALYDKNPIKAGDIIYAANLYKNNSGYWYLLEYKKET